MAKLFKGGIIYLYIDKHNNIFVFPEQLSSGIFIFVLVFKFFFWNNYIFTSNYNYGMICHAEDWFIILCKNSASHQKWVIQCEDIVRSLVAIFLCWFSIYLSWLVYYNMQDNHYLLKCHHERGYSQANQGFNNVYRWLIYYICNDST